MKQNLDKFRKVIDEAIGFRFSAAASNYSLTVDEVRDSVVCALEKQFKTVETPPGATEIRRFIEGLSAEDLCLVIACRRGDESAWDELFGRFQPVVKAVAYRLASNPQDAEELAGSIWGELFGIRSDIKSGQAGKLAFYSGRGSLGGWLRAVTAQLAIDRYRENSRFVQLEDDRELENAGEGSAARASTIFRSTGQNPEDALSEKRTASDVSEAVVAAIQLLAPEDRLFLKMYYFDGLTLKEIGQILDFHEATASRRLGRIQAEIRGTTQRLLQSEYGWNESEIRNYLAETAGKISPNLEEIITGAVLLVILQGLALFGVQ